MEELKQETVDAWKKQYGQVFKCQIAGGTYVYRSLKRGEFEALQHEVMGVSNPQQGLSPDAASKLEDGMVELCVVHPSNAKVADMPAGAPAVLATYISNASGFVVDEEPIAL